MSTCVLLPCRGRARPTACCRRQHRLASHVDSVNTEVLGFDMPKPRPTKPARKPANRYHHGDLPHAMLQEAVRTIQKDGVDALTLRCVGERLGVSRTALYRHFADKQALLAAVAAE